MNLIKFDFTTAIHSKSNYFDYGSNRSFDGLWYTHSEEWKLTNLKWFIVYPNDTRIRIY